MLKNGTIYILFYYFAIWLIDQLDTQNYFFFVGQSQNSLIFFNHIFAKCRYEKKITEDNYPM